MSRGKFYWFCPQWDGQAVQGGAAPGIGNLGNDIAISLIDTDFADPGDPRQDNFVVERIIGQYKVNAITGAPGGDRVIHHRVYVADSDTTSIALRNLYTADDADSSFLWHKVDTFADNQIGQAWGNWRNGNDAEPQIPFQNGRLGGFDIKVGRRVEEGQTLVWHTQVHQSVAIPLEDEQFFLMLWIRLLMREA